MNKMKWLNEFYGVDELSKPVLYNYFRKMMKRFYKNDEEIPEAIRMLNSHFRFVDSTPEEFGIKLYTVWYDDMYYLFLSQDGVIYKIAITEDIEKNHIDNKCVSRKRLIRVAENSPDNILNTIADSSAMCHLSALGINNVTCDFDCDDCTFSNFTKIQEFLEEE